eukprot:gene12533-6355_t
MRQGNGVSQSNKQKSISPFQSLNTRTPSPYRHSPITPSVKSPNSQEIGAEKLSESLKYPDVDTYYEKESEKPEEYKFTADYAEKGYREVFERSSYGTFLAPFNPPEYQKFWKNFEDNTDAIRENWKSYTTTKTREEIQKQYEGAIRTVQCSDSKVNGFPGRSSKLDKDKWLDNFADNKRTLKELGSQSIPHGFRVENLLDILFEKQITISRAIWLIKLMCLNQYVSERDKNPNLSEKWTNMMISGLSDLKNCTKEKLNYLLMLQKGCLEERILDDNLFENWILTKIKESLGVSINLNDDGLWIVEGLFYKPSEVEMHEIHYLISKQLSLKCRNEIELQLLTESTWILMKNSPRITIFLKSILNEMNLKQVLLEENVEFLNIMFDVPTHVHNLDSFYEHGNFEKTFTQIFPSVTNLDGVHIICEWAYTKQRYSKNRHYLASTLCEKLSNLIKKKTQKEYPLQQILFEFLKNKLRFITLKEEFDGLKFLFTELIRVKAFSFEKYLNDVYSIGILSDHLKFIENLFEKRSNSNSVNFRRNILYGPMKRRNENSSIEDLYHVKDYEIIVQLKKSIRSYMVNPNENFNQYLKNFLDSSNLYQIYTSIERILVELNSKDIDETQWERFFFILKYVGDYITLIDILKKKIENSNEFSSFFVSILVSLKDVLLCLNMIDDVSYLIIKKCSNSSKEHHRLIEDFMKRLNAEYPNIINFEHLQKEFSALSFFLQGIKNIPNTKRISSSFDRELGDNIKETIEKIENLNDLKKVVESLKEIKNLKKNTDAVLIFKFSIQKFISLVKTNEYSAILYVTLMRELYSSGFLTMSDISDAISNYIQSNFLNELDSIGFTKFLVVCVSKGIISSENLIENILENTFKNLNRELRTNQFSSFDKHFTFIESILIDQKNKEKLNYNGKFIPRIVKKIVEFVDQKEAVPFDISEKMIKVLEDIFFEKTIFEKIACQPEILKNCLKELQNLPEIQKEKSFKSFLKSLYKRSNMNEVPPDIDTFSILDFIKYLTRNTSIWNSWLNSFTFEEVYLKNNILSNENEILSKLIKPSFDIKSKNEKNLIAYTHLISSQKIVKEKFVSELSKLFANYSTQNLVKIKTICYSLMNSKRDHKLLEAICKMMIPELNNLIHFSKVHSIIKDSIEFEENRKKLIDLLTIYNDVTTNLKIISSSIFEPLRNLLYCKWTNYDSFNNLMHKIFTQIFRKLDNEKKYELKKIVMNDNGIKKGWDIIEDFTAHCQNCSSSHGKVTPYQYTPTTIKKRKLLFFESETKKQKFEK